MPCFFGLCGVVAEMMETTVVLCTREVFYRLLCVGDMATVEDLH